MLRDFFTRQRKIDIGTQTDSPIRLSTAPTEMEHAKSVDDEPYHFPPPPEKKVPSILYADKYCELTRATLKIYNFPVRPQAAPATKQILTSAIKAVYFQEQDGFLDCCSVAIVGHSRGTVWAFDHSRYTFNLCCSAPSTETNIVLDAGYPAKFGFTVEDGIGFIALLQAALGSKIEIYEGLP